MDKVFADGIYFDRNDNAPDFVIGKISIQIGKALPFLQENANEKGYVNLQVKRSKGGKLYVELDTWQPQQPNYSGTAQPAAQQPAAGAGPDDKIPF